MLSPARGETTHVSLVVVVDLDQFRHVILVVFVVRLCDSSGVTTGSAGGTTGLGAVVLLCDLTEGREGVGTELVEDVGHEVGEFLGDSVAVDGVGVGSRSGVDCRRAGRVPSVVGNPPKEGGGLTGRALEVEDLAVVHEHVDLVYGTDALHVELLEGGLELLVIGGTGLLGSDLPPDRSLGAACVRRVRVS